MKRLFAALALAAIIPACLAAQTPSQPEPGSNLTIYLLTMGPGDQVWEKFGHNAIWIHDEATHTDSAYHWGLFDFADKDFVPRFIQGRMRYAMGSFGLGETLEMYRRTNRTVWMQRLNMTPAQKQKLFDFVKWNVRPENRYYRYDYFRDNCSTRVRDAIDMALGGSVRQASTGIATNTTYRSHTSRLTQDDWSVFTGTMIGLGQPTDRPIDAWEEMFLPVRMMERFKTLQIPTATGNAPLVLEQEIAVPSSRAPEDSTIRRGIAGYLAIAAVLIAIVALSYTLSARGKGTGFLIVAAAWSLITGISGTVLAFLWLFTDHLYSYRNENLFYLNPFSLVFFVFIVILLIRKRDRDMDRANVTATRIAILALIGFAIQILPWFNQVNGDVIAMVLPVHIAVGIAFIALGRKRLRTSTGPA
ncbi:MAG TPA: DUF4105 domain-containing protein [Gemmatimonadaceae bacterium]|nr:DUF4105 domain-containing protein [Gemmatimonadaceae bacterium]